MVTLAGCEPDTSGFDSRLAPMVRSLRYAMCTSLLLAASCFTPDYPIVNRAVQHCSVAHDTCPPGCYCQHNPLLLDSTCVWRETDASGHDIMCGSINVPYVDRPAGTVTGYADMAVQSDAATN